MTKVVYQAPTAPERLAPVGGRIETWDADRTLFPGFDVRLTPGQGTAAGEQRGGAVVGHRAGDAARRHDPLPARAPGRGVQHDRGRRPGSRQPGAGGLCPRARGQRRGRVGRPLPGTAVRASAPGARAAAVSCSTPHPAADPRRTRGAGPRGLQPGCIATFRLPACLPACLPARSLVLVARGLTHPNEERSCPLCRRPDSSGVRSWPAVSQPQSRRRPCPPPPTPVRAAAVRTRRRRVRATEEHRGADGETDVNVCSYSVAPGTAHCNARIRTDPFARTRLVALRAPGRRRRRATVTRRPNGWLRSGGPPGRVRHALVDERRGHDRRHRRRVRRPERREPTSPSTAARTACRAVHDRRTAASRRSTRTAAARTRRPTRLGRGDRARPRHGQRHVPDLQHPARRGREQLVSPNLGAAVNTRRDASAQWR